MLKRDVSPSLEAKRLVHAPNKCPTSTVMVSAFFRIVNTKASVLRSASSSRTDLINAVTKELYTLLLSVYLVRLSQLYEYSYCIYKVKPEEIQPNNIVVKSVLTVLTMEHFSQCIYVCMYETKFCPRHNS